ncbi:MAG: hypothetical protein KGD59_00670 [Candidatus Heimdallarchaeota archaeon]|nr:hypothetical protein [Candidatus Heimdallarchaeota archaeon]MBY8993030.1 hypothetical protein [Candidatus Heimdallarchaeota archaeon]
MSESTLYKYCPNCGAKLVIMDGIFTITCNKCEIKLAYDTKTELLVVLGEYVQFSAGKVSQTTPRKTRDYGKKRSYFLYFLFGIWTLGIGFIVYMFRNLRDLENHHSEYKIEKGAEPILSDGELFPNFNSMMRDRFFYTPWYSGIFGLITIVFDILSASIAKYSMLYYHLKKQSKETAPTKSPHSSIYLTGLILFLITAPITIATMITSITFNFTILVQSITFYAAAGLTVAGFLIIVICGALWQRAFNDHVEVMKRIDPN